MEIFSFRNFSVDKIFLSIFVPNFKFLAHPEVGNLLYTSVTHRAVYNIDRLHSTTNVKMVCVNN